MAEINGKMKWIFILIGFIFTLLTTAMSYTWGSVCDNRKKIDTTKDVVVEKLDELQKDIYKNRQDILQRLTKIETKLEDD